MPPDRLARVAAALALLSAAPAEAALVRVPALPGAARSAVATAAPGDTILLARGEHDGPIAIRARLTLRGEPGALVDGRARGPVLAVEASGVAVEDLEIRGSGRRVLTADAGIRILSSHAVALRRLRLRDVLYGVYGERCDSLRIEDTRLEGRSRPGSERVEGNGIHLWSCRDARVVGCVVRHFADGVYLSFTHGSTFSGCFTQENARYGFHTMYCQDTRLRRNRFAQNVAGCAIMFSNHLAVDENQFALNRGPRTYGLLLRDCSDGSFRWNQLTGNTIAVFMDGSNRNRFVGNLVQDNGWGLFLFASSDGNVFSENTFLNNDYPVALDMRYTDNQFDDGIRGNYWSESAPYDLDADGVGDVPYSPVSAFAFLSKQYPDLAVLARSPAVAALGVAERVVPALRPSEALDRFPLLRPMTPGAAAGPSTLPRRRASWSHAAAFGALAAAGALGLVRGRKSG